MAVFLCGKIFKPYIFKEKVSFYWIGRENIYFKKSTKPFSPNKCNCHSRVCIARVLLMSFKQLALCFTIEIRYAMQARKYTPRCVLLCYFTSLLK